MESTKQSSLSKADSYAGIGEYWDDHDLGTVWDQTEAMDVEVDLRSTSVYCAIERDLAQQLIELAAGRGVSPETLINLWIQEKIAATANSA